MVRWIKSLFAWRAVKAAGVWVYLENTVTGRRKAVWKGGGYGPLDRDFLRDGDIVVGHNGPFIIGGPSELWN